MSLSSENFMFFHSSGIPRNKLLATIREAPADRARHAVLRNGRIKTDTIKRLSSFEHQHQNQSSFHNPSNDNYYDPKGDCPARKCEER